MRHGHDCESKNCRYVEYHQRFCFVGLGYQNWYMRTVVCFSNFALQRMFCIDCSVVIALCVSFSLLSVASWAAEILFDTGLAAGALVRISGAQIAIIIIAVIGFVVSASTFAARAALRTDPATVLREGA